ncbi:MAG: type II secretion system protein [Pseudomonadota bacterium]
MKQRQAGFTLMEMIGVVAVIAILASMATPMIFDAIRNARVTAFVEDVNVVRTAVARYYQDTSSFPDHRNNTTNLSQRRLLSNNPASPVGGWNGPYLETDLENPFNEGSFGGVLFESNANYQFDLDGDGNIDTTRVSVLRMDGVSDSEAKKISNILDGDGDVTTGNGAWNVAGRVKRYGSGGIIVYLAQE